MSEEVKQEKISSYSFMEGAGIVVSGNEKGSGMIQLKPALTSSGGDVILLDNVLIGKADAGTPKDALGDEHAFYVFGKTFSQAQIEGTIYMGCSSSGSGGGGVQKVQKWFQSNRISGKKSKPIKVSILSKTVFQLFVISLQFTNPDPKFNSIKFIISGYTTPS